LSELPVQATPAAETIVSRQYIRVLLEQAANRSNLLKVSHLNKPQDLISTLLRVEGEGRTFVLDRPYSVDSATSELGLTKADLVNISGMSGNASLSFQAEFREVIQEEGLSLYRFAFPEEISYVAQRASHRVNTRDFDTLISFTTSSGYTFQAPLCDISDGGLRVRAERDIIKLISKGDHIYCALDIDDDCCKKLEVKLCKPSKVDDPKLIEFGATFVELLPYQKSQISHYIAGLERKLLRKQHAIPEAAPLNESPARKTRIKESPEPEEQQSI
jgi:c-di-GMP-binding flagellar brake protein YcgR